jgi:riboflavin synthase
MLTGMVVKGSIACDGVSLTIAHIDDGSFEAHIIPHTWEQTAFRSTPRGGHVNLETDLIGKYVRRGLAEKTNENDLTMEHLVKAGILVQQLPV